MTHTTKDTYPQAPPATTMPHANADLSMSLVESLLNGVNPDPLELGETIGDPKGHGEVVDEEEEEEMDEGTVQVRTMAIPRWLSTMDVTMHIIGNGGKRCIALEEEYLCKIVITGHGSGGKDPNAPGYNLPHLLVTMTGSDTRSLGRARLAIEHLLIDFVIENSPKKEVVNANGDTIIVPPPSLGRLFYSLGISAADASPRTLDRRPDRTVLARSPTLTSLSNRLKTERKDLNANFEFKTRKIWMNVSELPQDPKTLEYHGRFLASKSLRTYYRTTFKCRVDIIGVWDTEEGGGSGVDDLMCAPYVLITSDEKVNVDKCITHVEHRIREHEEKFEMSRTGGRRLLRGESASEAGCVEMESST